MIDLDDERLAEVLASVGQLLVTAPVVSTASPSSPVSRALPEGPASVRASRWRSAPAVALAGIAACLIVVLAVAPLRSAVADWLGIGSTRIEIDPIPPSTVAPLLPIDADLPRIDRDAAEVRLGAPLPQLDTSSLGAPAGYARMPEGGVLVIWPDATLWIHEEVIEPDMYFDKLISAGQDVQRVDDLGEGAFVISGDHVLRTPHRMVSATTTVLWQADRREYRLEADADAATLIDVARQLADEL
jgi:hypothetical protein